MTLKFEDFDNGQDGHAVNLMDNIEDPNERNPLNLLLEMDQKQTLARLIEELPEKEKMVLNLYYWEELTMKEVGAVLGLTESRVCQLHTQALLRLRAKLSKEEQDRAGPEKTVPVERRKKPEEEPSPVPLRRVRSG